jgi:hypothetical protein
MITASASCWAAALTGAVWAAGPALAQSPVPQFTAELHGGIVRAANSVMTCLRARYGRVTCGQAQQGARVENYLYWMTFINADSQTGFFDSSAADLDLPAGAAVRSARLYWGGPLDASLDNPDLPAGNRLAPEPSLAGRVEFKPPDAAAYATITASPDSVTTAKLSGHNFYQASANVTSLVAHAGAGKYWIADVQTARGDGSSAGAGWTLIAVYQQKAGPLRQVTIYNQLTAMRTNAPAFTFGLRRLSGPSCAGLHSALGVVAYEGDAGSGGESITIDDGMKRTPVLDAANPADNVFNSTITTLGRQEPARDPAYRNTLGYDSDVYDISGALRGREAEPLVTLSSRGDAYLLGPVFVQGDVCLPHTPLRLIRLIRKHHEPARGASPRPELPATGMPLRDLAAAAAILLTAGSMAITASSRRRQRALAPGRSDERPAPNHHAC